MSYICLFYIRGSFRISIFCLHSVLSIYSYIAIVVISFFYLKLKLLKNIVTNLGNISVVLNVLVHR